MLINDFEDIIGWQKAQELAEIIYKKFSSNKDFGFRDQIQRCCVSISNNIAEGFERKSNNEFKYFLYVAKGSCGELRSMLSLAYKIGYFQEPEFKDLYIKTKEISQILGGLIKSLNNSENDN